jgi:hypothetical protein
MGEIQTWIGVDVAKADHHATVIDAAGEIVLDRDVRNDEQAIERLLDAAGEGSALVIDHPGSIGTLAVAVARRRGIPVAYVPGLVMRRASALYPGVAKTDRRDSFVIADTARIHQARVHWLAASDELLDELRVLAVTTMISRTTAPASRTGYATCRSRPRLRSSACSARRSSTPRSGRKWSATRPPRRCALPASVACSASFSRVHRGWVPGWLASCSRRSTRRPSWSRPSRRSAV